MKSLKTLIKLEQFKLEEQRLVLKGFYEKRDALSSRVEKISHDLTVAKENYGGDLHEDDETVMTGTIHTFIQQSLAVINDLNAAISHIDKDIAVEQDKLKDIFANVKKFEITEEKRILAEKEAQQKKDQQNLDEVSTQKYALKQKV